MSVGILPGMASYAGGSMPSVAADQGTAAISAGLAAPGLGKATAGGKLAINVGADGTVASTIVVFALLYFGVMLAFHGLEHFG